MQRAVVVVVVGDRPVHWMMGGGSRASAWVTLLPVQQAVTGACAHWCFHWRGSAGGAALCSPASQWGLSMGALFIVSLLPDAFERASVEHLDEGPQQHHRGVCTPKGNCSSPLFRISSSAETQNSCPLPCSPPSPPCATLRSALSLVLRLHPLRSLRCALRVTGGPHSWTQGSDAQPQARHGDHKCEGGSQPHEEGKGGVQVRDQGGLLGGEEGGFQERHFASEGPCTCNPLYPKQGGGCREASRANAMLVVCGGGLF